MNIEHTSSQLHSMNSREFQDNGSLQLQSTVYIKCKTNNTILVEDKSEAPVTPADIRKYSICKQQSATKRTKLKIGGNEPGHSYDISLHTSGIYINISIKPGKEYYSDANGYITIILHDLGSITDDIDLH